MKKIAVTLSVLILFFFTADSFSQSAGDYRSATDGDWSLPATWETFDGTNWVPAVSTPTGTEDITIEDSVNVDVVVSVTGDVQVEGTGILSVGVGSLAFDNGSTYEHARNSGTLPTATWGVGSICLITGIEGNSPGNANQDFYDFIWDCPGQSSNLNLAWSGNTIGGNLTCVNSGSGRFQMTNNTAFTDPITINGDVIVIGGVLTSNGSSGAQTYTINVNGNVNVTGGNLSLSRGSGGIANWYLYGDFSVANATLQTSNNSSKFVFAALDDTQQVSLSLVSYTGTFNYDVDSAVTINIVNNTDTVDLTVRGIFTNNGAIIKSDSLAVISFENNAVYRHVRAGGSIPVSTWRTGSTCEITGVTTGAPANGNQNFHHVIWDCPNQTGNYNLGWNENTIGGNITITNTGVGRWQLCAPTSGNSATVDILGSIIQTGGNFSSNGTGNANTTIVINLYGDVTVTGGNFSVSRGSQGNTGTTTWNLYGTNFSLSDATTQNSNSAGAKFVFTGTNPQTLTFTNVTFGSGGCPVEVATGSTLNVGTSQFGGSGIFTLNAGATLGCGNEGGLDSTLQNTGTTSLSTSANFIFNGTAAQIAGSLLPATVNDLTVDNNAGVTLNANVQVDGNLNVMDGDLNLNGNIITLGTSATLNETSGNTVTGTSGKIMITRDLNAPLGINVGGLGAMVTSSADLGSTLVERYHSAGTGLGNEGILRQFNIVPGNNSGLDATFRFYYDESELNNIPEANLTMFKSPNGVNNTWNGVGGTVNTTDNYVELSGIGDFSYWTLGDVNNPIPVELTSFSASTDEKFVALNWVTASEINNYGWDIERRIKNDENNFSDWIKAGFVKGSGNTIESVSYTFSDKNITSGVFQYRLKQIDFDGTFTYSNIAEVEINGPTEFALFQNYPNPFNPETVIRFEVPVTAFVNLTVYNAIGEKVATLINQQMERGVYLWNFNAGDYPSGIYIYRLNTGDQIFTKKMVLIK
jgi:hypothetical protein